MVNAFQFVTPGHNCTKRHMKHENYVASYAMLHSYLTVILAFTSEGLTFACSPCLTAEAVQTRR